uniref:Uncharacterized protein n=1 Tax=Seriola dumerili TaxID=41447 RepID=A0A3B4ULX6_SERDU
MSATSCLLTEEQLLCCICLDVFTDPVTLPCGHNFCKTCITQHWDINVQCQCPSCKELFHRRLDLRVNTFISEMAAQFRQSGRMCTIHDKPLELFCKTDQTCVCMLCPVLDHKLHEVIPMKKEFESKKAELRKTEAETDRMIQERRLKVQEVEHSVKLSREAADRETADGVQVFAALTQSVERAKAEFIGTIKEKKRAKEEQAKGVIRELEQEISELTRRRAEVDRLSRSEDHLHFLRTFSTLNAAPPTNDRTEISIDPPSYEGTVSTAVDQLEETLGKEIKKLRHKAELKRVRQFAVDVTLDPDTAHPALVLSGDGKQAHHGDENSFSSGRFYFETGVKGKTRWTLGVAKKSIKRKGIIPLCPENGYWTMWLKNGDEYAALVGSPLLLSLPSKPEKVGVFVDYEEGLVSFYDADSAELLYSFTGCSFAEEIYLFFSPGLNDGINSAPMIISPVTGGEGGGRKR